MLFRRKKKKKINDDKQLLLFTLEEMKGGKDSTSMPDSIPSSSESDEGLTNQQAPITIHEQPIEVSRSNETVKTENSGIINCNYVDHRLMLEAMRKAILHLSSLSIKDIRLIAIESATYAQGGVNIDQTYCLQALKGQELSGYEFIAYYYVSFARSFPTMLDKIGLPYSDIYEEALSLGR